MSSLFRCGVESNVHSMIIKLRSGKASHTHSRQAEEVRQCARKRHSSHDKNVIIAAPCARGQYPRGRLESMGKAAHAMASSESQTPYATVSVEVDTQVSILDMGVKFSYRLPSFSVLHVDLRQINFQITAEEGCVMMFDGFMSQS